jgi:apolipoprotein N-acyltransferase
MVSTASDAESQQSVSRYIDLSPPTEAPNPALDDARRMEKLFWLIGATVGGWLGWWLGEPMGIMAAVMLSAVGTGVGIYLAYRIIRDYF